MRIIIELFGQHAKNLKIPTSLAEWAKGPARFFAPHILGVLPVLNAATGAIDHPITPSNFYQRLEEHLAALPAGLVQAQGLGEYVGTTWNGDLNWAGFATYDMEIMGSLSVEHAAAPANSPGLVAWVAAGGTEETWWMVYELFVRRTLAELKRLAPNVSWDIYGWPLQPGAYTVTSSYGPHPANLTRFRKVAGYLRPPAQEMKIHSNGMYHVEGSGVDMRLRCDATQREFKLAWGDKCEFRPYFWPHDDRGNPMPAAVFRKFLVSLRLGRARGFTLWRWVNSVGSANVIQTWMDGVMAPTFLEVSRKTLAQLAAEPATA